MHVCKISSLTKRKSFEGHKENIEVLKAYTKYWFVVFQRSKVWASWLLWLGLCGMQGWKKEHIGHMSIIGKITCFMVIKEANSVALSTVEAEYISAGSCCAQIPWMKATLNYFRIKFKKVPLLCDNESAIKLTNNLVQHVRTKHIDVRHHFIRDHQQK